MPQIYIFILAVALLLGSCSAASAQENTEQRTQSLVAALSKSKYKKKEKGNFSFERYIDIKSEAVVKNSARDYAGVYQSESSDYRIELRISSNGSVEGNGYDFDFKDSQKRSFTLKNARIAGALLTATKVYTSGEAKDYEAVFINQTVTEGKNPNEINSRKTRYGLGFVDSWGTMTNRVFLEAND